jgi:hypothetical protein
MLSKQVLKKHIICEESIGLFNKYTGKFYMYVCPFHGILDDDWRDEIDLLFGEAEGNYSQETIEWIRAQEPNEKVYEIIDELGELMALIYSENSIEDYRGKRLEEIFDGHLKPNGKWISQVFY